VVGRLGGAEHDRGVGERAGGGGGIGEIGRAGLGAVDGGARPRDDRRAVAAGDQGVDDRSADGPGAEHQWSLEAGGGHGGHDGHGCSSWRVADLGRCS
jgi:hypothetical protein